MEKGIGVGMLRSATTSERSERRRRTITWEGLTTAGEQGR
jgi:hypothetical protein